MMGGQCSKKNGGDSPQPQPQPQANSDSPSQSRPITPPTQPLQISKSPMLSTHLSSYETACEFDLSVQSFDENLQKRTARVLGTLQTGVEVRSLSFDSLMEITDCFLDVDKEVVRVILENKSDIWENEDMLDLVEQYFDNSSQTLEFCASLENCLRRAATNQLIIRAAVSQFEEELRGGPAGFEKTLQALDRFRAAGDPFTEEFFAMLQSILTKQLVMFERLSGKKRDIDKKLRSLKTWRRVSNVIFVATFVTVLVCSVVAAALTAPPVVTALLGAVTVPIGSVGKWCSSLWNRYVNAVKGQKEIINSIQAGTYVTLNDLENIRVLVNKLEIQIQSLMGGVDFALVEEGSVKVAMDEIKRNLEAFTETTEVLSQKTNKCIQDVTNARRVIVQRIIKHPSS